MSVRVSERNNGKLMVLDKMSKLAVYTIHTLKKEKIIPKGYRWLISEKIANECLEAQCCMKRANSIYPKTASKELLNYRIMQQNEAYAHLEALLMLIDNAYNLFEIEDRIIHFWVGLVVETENLLKGWIKG
ncbi:MAG: hypothetical protein KBT03_03300 [Bacteroidales bacterium]|nr:hypothetical protein [Candidatus Scybalousia scybalohippi]